MTTPNPTAIERIVQRATVALRRIWRRMRRRQRAVSITGVHVFSDPYEDNDTGVALEIDGEWVTVWKEPAFGMISHFVEVPGILRCQRIAAAARAQDGEAE